MDGVGQQRLRNAESPVGELQHTRFHQSAPVIGLEKCGRAWTVAHSDGSAEADEQPVHLSVPA